MLADRNARVLVAEDNITNQQVAMSILKHLGLRADAVVNGEEVLKTLSGGDYDLVLMDVQMPVMDGLTATRTIRQNPNLAGLPVIALTAGVLPEERQAALDAGVTEFLPKPLDLKHMKERLSTFSPSPKSSPS